MNIFDTLFIIHKIGNHIIFQLKSNPNNIQKILDTIRKLDVVIMKFLKYLICFFTYRLMLTNIFICHTPVDGERLLHQK